jgi:uncharacterized protein
MKKELYVGNSKINGKGLFCKTAIKKGEHITFIQGTLRKFKSLSPKQASQIPTWYGINKTTWIDPGDTIFAYFNHSCDPNTAIIGTKTVVARKNISVGEELTFDYSLTDGDLNWTLDINCNCGARKCRRNIRSIQKLPAIVLKNHYPLIQRYFLKLYLRAHPNVTISGWGK